MRGLTAFLLSLLLALSLLWAVSANGGSSSDPVVSKSYVDGEYKENVINNAKSKISLSFDGFISKYITKAESKAEASANALRGDGVLNKTAEYVLEELQKNGKYLYSTRYMAPVELEKGDIIYGAAGTQVTVLSGKSEAFGGSIVNITSGKEFAKGSALSQNNLLMFTEDSVGIKISSDNAKVLIDGSYGKVSGEWRPRYYKEVDALCSLGLVRGAANGLELSRANTRAESITMLIRLLGEEESAMSFRRPHPFTDVDTWAQNYVGYAYDRGYTNGVSPTRYDGTSPTTANHYMTFVLRTLGYDDTKGDFKWDSAMDDAVRLGVISASELAVLREEPFYRDQVMFISYKALFARLKGSSMTLLDKLVGNGVVSMADANKIR